MQQPIRIGTRDSQLAVWQATEVKRLLQIEGFTSEFVFIKSEGDIDATTPLYEMGVQGVFTRSLDIALLQEKIDIAVHSMKDVPTQLAAGIMQAAVLKRGAVEDLLVYKADQEFAERDGYIASIATSSIRRKAQWLNRYPLHEIHNLRGNVNTRLRKLQEEKWDAAIFAKAGLERIGLIPDKSFTLDWMLPAPAQGAIVIVCRKADDWLRKACSGFNDEPTETCTKIERDFLRALLGGCSTPISAWAVMEGGLIRFRGNIVSPDGKHKAEIGRTFKHEEFMQAGISAAKELLDNGGYSIAETIRKQSKLTTSP